MAVNLAVKYAKELDQTWAHGSYTDQHVNKNYKFDGVKTVNVYTVTTQALSDYNRTGTGDRYGGNNEVQDVITPYTLEKDRGFKLVIDAGNLEQGARAKQAAKVLKAEMNEQVTPEIDKDRLATVSTGATTVSQVVTATSGKEYEAVLDANALLDEAQAPHDGRVLVITPAYYKLVKSEIVMNAHGDNYNSKLIGKGYVGELDGVPVRLVPSSYFPAGVNALLWHKDALLGVRQITSVRIEENSEMVDGTLLMGRFIYGSFVLKGKEKGVAAIKQKASS